MIYLVCSNKEKALGHTTLDTQNQQILFNLISVLLPFKTGKKRNALSTFHTLALLFTRHSAIRHIAHVCYLLIYVFMCNTMCTLLGKLILI